MSKKKGGGNFPAKTRSKTPPILIQKPPKGRDGASRSGGPHRAAKNWRFQEFSADFFNQQPRPTEGVGHLWRVGCGGRPGAYPPPTDLAHRIWVTARAPSALRRPSSTPRSGGRATGGGKRRSYLASSEGVFVLHCKLHGIDLCNLLILARPKQINKDLGVLPDRKSGI